MSYKDRCFCASSCENKSCRYYFSQEDSNRSKELNLLVAWTDYSEKCDEYITTPNSKAPWERNAG